MISEERKGIIEIEFLPPIRMKKLFLFGLFGVALSLFIPQNTNAQCTELTNKGDSCAYSIFEGSFDNLDDGNSFNTTQFLNLLKAVDNNFGYLYWKENGVNPEKIELRGGTNSIEQVGIGTTPSAKLHIKGDGATSSTFSLQIQNSADAHNMVVRDNGFVGIGTTTQNTGDETVLLGVNGVVGASAYCDLNGNNCTSPSGTGIGQLGWIIETNSLDYSVDSRTNAETVSITSTNMDTATSNILVNEEWDEAGGFTYGTLVYIGADAPVTWANMNGRRFIYNVGVEGGLNEGWFNIFPNGGAAPANHKPIIVADNVSTTTIDYVVRAEFVFDASEDAWVLVSYSTHHAFDDLNGWTNESDSSIATQRNEGDVVEMTSGFLDNETGRALHISKDFSYAAETPTTLGTIHFLGTTGDIEDIDEWKGRFFSLSTKDGAWFNIKHNSGETPTITGAPIDTRTKKDIKKVERALFSYNQNSDMWNLVSYTLANNNGNPSWSVLDYTTTGGKLDEVFNIETPVLDASADNLHIRLPEEIQSAGLLSFIGSDATISDWSSLHGRQLVVTAEFGSWFDIRENCRQSVATNNAGCNTGGTILDKHRPIMGNGAGATADSTYLPTIRRVKQAKFVYDNEEEAWLLQSFTYRRNGDKQETQFTAESVDTTGGYRNDGDVVYANINLWDATNGDDTSNYEHHIYQMNYDDNAVNRSFGTFHFLGGDIDPFGTDIDDWSEFDGREITLVAGDKGWFNLAHDSGETIDAGYEDADATPRVQPIDLIGQMDANDELKYLRSATLRFSATGDSNNDYPTGGKWYLLSYEKIGDFVGTYPIGSGAPSPTSVTFYGNAPDATGAPMANSIPPATQYLPLNGYYQVDVYVTVSEDDGNQGPNTAIAQTLAIRNGASGAFLGLDMSPVFVPPVASAAKMKNLSLQGSAIINVNEALDSNRYLTWRVLLPNVTTPSPPIAMGQINGGYVHVRYIHNEPEGTTLP